MLRFHTIRRIRGPADERRLEKVTEFFASEFPSSLQYLDLMRERLRHPLKVPYALVVVTAEEAGGEVLGFAAYDHFPDLGLSYLEYLATSPGARGRGVGGGLYEAMRERLVHGGSEGLVFEVNADDEDLPPGDRQEHRAALRFYERYGARPLDGVRFDYPPFSAERPRLLLLYDDLGSGRDLDGRRLREFLRTLYRVKYGADLRQAGVRAILDAVPDGVLPRRLPRQARAAPEPSPRPVLGEHLVLVEAILPDPTPVREPSRDRDLLEQPLRTERLLEALRGLPFVRTRIAKGWPDRHVLEVHDRGLVRYLRNASAGLTENEVVQPAVFPVRRRVGPPQGQPTHAGYYLMDSFTPLTRHAYPAARAAVDVALTAAEHLLTRAPEGPVYALTRPPGHHAERDLVGGFCYLNNVAVAAHHLARHGRVAVLDLDFHHGNGTQQIFYARADVLTVSLHGDPRVAYPYFSGFAHERGEGEGAGSNLNLPLPAGTGDDAYLAALRKACREIERFAPDHLVVALGLDTSKDDPSGSFRITRRGFARMGRAAAELGVPAMVTQEGGYNLRQLGANLRAFLEGWVLAQA